MKKSTAPFKKSDKVICLDGIDSSGRLKKNRVYTVAETDGIRVRLEDVPLTWANIRFRKAGTSFRQQ